jgi:hypothetical protein
MDERQTVRHAAALAMILLATAPAGPAASGPPPGAHTDPATQAWFHSLRSREGWSCCTIADCRQTQVQPNDDGRVLAYIGKDEYGPAAPNAWMEIPPRELRSRGERPGTVRGAIVCFADGRVLCADLEGAS